MQTGKRYQAKHVWSEQTRGSQEPVIAHLAQRCSH